VGPLRQVPTRRLISLIGGLLAAIGATAAIAIASTGSGPKPPPSKLDAALHRALSAPDVAGVTARVQFTNHLVDSAGIPGSSPILSGATGRLWASADGRVRLELQSDGGGGEDAQVVLDKRHVSLYEPRSNTLYRATLPSPPADRSHHSEGGTPTVSAIDRALARVARYARLSGAQPGDTAGKATYTVRVSPRAHGGLVGGARLAWDAANGVPLRAAVYAAGSSDPVLDLEATHVAYGTVPQSTFALPAPAGAKVVDLTGKARKATARSRNAKHAPAVTGVGPVTRKAGFAVSAPAELAGRPRTQVRLVGAGDHPAALVSYGNGLDAVTVLESPAKGESTAPPKAKEHQMQLPEVRIGTARGQELRTSLGTLIRFERQGVSYVVVGSVTPAVAEAAARAL
jgi:outer membrane lipoprotein-sorting protein